jgi:hypothetical protein
MSDRNIFSPALFFFVALFVPFSHVQGAENERVITLKNSCRKDGWIIVTDGYGSEHENLDTYFLSANSSVDFHWPAPFNNVVWSGNFGICLNGTCEASSSKSCDDGGCFVAANGPMSRAEFTIATGSDFYDISIINGINVPMSITPYGVLSSNEEDAYWCGNPGAKIPLNSLAAPSYWDIQPPSSSYNWVISGGLACSDDNDCNQGDICGLSNNIGQDPQFYLSCGQPDLGYWTADQVCGADMNFGAPFNCSQHMSNGPSSSTTMWTYLGCTDGISSCYQQGAPSSCCGCFDWWTVDDGNIPVPPAPLTESCVNSNSEWVETAGQFLKFLKQACPSCYTYPYDDMSSTFICNSGTDVNTVDYIVEFCPE